MAGEPALLRVGGQVAGVVVVVMAAQTKRMNQLRLHQQDLAQDLGTTHIFNSIYLPSYQIFMSIYLPIFTQITIYPLQLNLASVFKL